MKRTWAILIHPPLSDSEAGRILGRIRKASPRIQLIPLCYSPRAGMKTLTSRQKDVLRELATGKGTKQIGCSLAISPKTVETHRQNIMDRLRIYHIPGLLRYALQTGILPGTWLQ